MGYALNVVNSPGPPFLVVHEQVVLAPPQGSQTTVNAVRKLIFVLGGECRHRIAGWKGEWTTVHLRPGDILALPYRCVQHYVTPEPGSKGQLHVVRLAFDPALLPALPMAEEKIQPLQEKDAPDLVSLADRSLRQVHFLRGAALDTAFQETLTDLRDEARRRLPGYRLRIHGLCASLTVLYARKVLETRPVTASSGDSATEYHVGKIKDYLRSRCPHAPRLGEVAAQAGLSEEYTTRLFRKVTGTTISEYERRLQISAAKNLLSTTENNIGEIARMTGYASLTVFSRNFKREEGITPTEYRQAIARQMG